MRAIQAPPERPILFTGPMVRAILAGRKEQTRRPVKPQPAACSAEPGCYADRYDGGPEWAFWLADNRMTEPRTWRCPYGAPGDRLWVRETMCVLPSTREEFYRADLQDGVEYEDGDGFTFTTAMVKCRSAIHMPRRASRLALEIESVRVERVQAISEEDAVREGFTAKRDETWTAYDPTCQGHPTFFAPPPSPPFENVRHHVREVPARELFETAWRHMYGGTPFFWSENPWVWVVTFRRLTEAK